MAGAITSPSLGQSPPHTFQNAGGTVTVPQARLLVMLIDVALPTPHSDARPDVFNCGKATCLLPLFILIARRAPTEETRLMGVEARLSKSCKPKSMAIAEAEADFLMPWRLGGSFCDIFLLDKSSSASPLSIR
mmetsp:Transcript_100778/g.178901  ORF Transcript_100778/g.178901 Transcript_100778/m.178901 type:complete len:133 (-) Transcript_100778:706-1104(-)